jgi:hypothetical protein
MNDAVAAHSTDVVGLGRPLVLEPELAHRLLTRADGASRVKPLHFLISKLRGAAELAWYSRQLARIANGRDPDPTLSMSWSLVVRIVKDWARARRLGQSAPLK